ncbi:MAG: (Dimethylallyl)adenosine tRNA methylthiotransferase MiaB [Parcubacteria group bacterium GW2011_GWE2_39_37]|nr:MAG: (Dimethylallyl)adenosine tRNA methylthiotransferase MiaB [Parcubacteria group bacterium GW2011_GWE2_39_37]
MKKTYHIITIGCQMNKSDSERMANFLEELGYETTEEKYKADLVIINTCGVRQLAEDRIYGFVPRIKKENPKVKIVITGCLSGRTDVQRRMNDYVDLWLLTKDMTKLAEFLNKADKRELPDSYLKIKPKYDSTFSALVPIGNGCDNFCTYCVVPHARGREVYRPAEDIINEVKELVGKGYKEIILIAQNVNSYESIINYELSITNKGNGRKINKKINFAELIRLVNDIPGNFWIRFATSHPKDMSDELIKALAECEKACHHIHLPVQAGDDEILARMNRKYTVEHCGLSWRKQKAVRRISEVGQRGKFRYDIHRQIQPTARYGCAENERRRFQAGEEKSRIGFD